MLFSDSIPYPEENGNSLFSVCPVEKNGQTATTGARRSAAVEGFEMHHSSGNMNYRILWNYHFDMGLAEEENIRIERGREGYASSCRRR